jgi:hypothetical protein
MADKRKRLQYYQARAGQLIRLAEKAYEIIRTRYEVNFALYESIPRKRAILASCLYFLELQIHHMKALLLLEKHKNLDVLLIVRSMVEGTAQILYVRKSSVPKDLALMWWNFLFHKQKGYWHRKQATAMVKLLEQHFDDLIWGPVDKSQLLAFYSHFSAYHHWNRTVRMQRHKEDSLSLAFGILCLRYTIESVNQFLDLSLDLGDSPLPV